jgi:isocitrate dehydrogenase kinase/phosphatase
VCEAESAAARRAVLDYGQAMRDLAATNIFPGDILPKNWGLTRQGRAVFYDYDELALLSDCRFRDLPEPQGVEQEALPAAEWLYAGETDIFPAEFLGFIGLPRPLREAFVEAHGDLLRPEFWRATQARLRAGELVEIFPYPDRRRLPHRRPG